MRLSYLIDGLLLLLYRYTVLFTQFRWVDHIDHIRLSP